MKTTPILSIVRQLVAIFTLGFAVLGVSSTRAATIEPAECVQRSAFPDFNGVFECFKICDDPDDSDPCPTCCPGSGGGGPGGGSPPERRLPPIGSTSSIFGNDCL